MRVATSGRSGDMSDKIRLVKKGGGEPTSGGATGTIVITPGVVKVVDDTKDRKPEDAQTGRG